MAGGVAGVVAWGIGYPMDSLKVRIQSGRCPERGLLRAIKWVHVNEGLPMLFKGVHVQMLRAFPTTATGMIVFETVRDNLRHLCI